jgi:hypothetical protein
LTNTTVGSISAYNDIAFIDRAVRAVYKYPTVLLDSAENFFAKADLVVRDMSEEDLVEPWSCEKIGLVP